MDVKKGVKNIIFSILSQVITLGLGIFVPRLVIVNYTSEVNGLLSSVSQVVTYLALLEAGVGAAALQSLYKPIAESDRKNINAILSATNRYYKRTGLIYLIFIIAISFIYPLIVASTLDYFFIVIIILLCGLPNVINYFFQGKLKIFLSAVGDGYVLTNISTIGNVLATLLKIVLLMQNINIILVQSIYSGVSLIQMLFIFLYARKKYGWINFKEEPDFKALSKKNAAIVHHVCSLVTNSTDIFIISIFCDLNAASIYSVYNMLFNIIYNLALSVNNGVQFIFGQSYVKDKKQYTRVIDTYESYYVGLCSTLMCVTYFMITPFITLYTATADINYVSFWIPILFIAVEILRSIRNSATNTINVSGRFKETSWHAVVESIINLSVSIVAVQYLGIIGVLVGTVVAFLFRDVASITFSNKKILGRSSVNSLKVIAVNVVLLAGFMLLANFLPFSVNSIWILIPIAVGVLIVTGAIFFIVNSLVSPSSFKLLKTFIGRKLTRRRR